jgi:hypothetical protein
MSTQRVPEGLPIVCIDVGADTSSGGFAYVFEGPEGWCSGGRAAGGPIEGRGQLGAWLRDEGRRVAVGLEAPLRVPSPSDHGIIRRRGLDESRDGSTSRHWYVNSGGATGLMAAAYIRWIVDLRPGCDVEFFEVHVTNKTTTAREQANSASPNGISDHVWDAALCLYAVRLAEDRPWFTVADVPDDHEPLIEIPQPRGGGCAQVTKWAVQVFAEKPLGADKDEIAACLESTAAR